MMNKKTTAASDKSVTAEHIAGLRRIITARRLLDPEVQQTLHRQVNDLEATESPRLPDPDNASDSPGVHVYLRSLIVQEGLLYGMFCAGAAGRRLFCAASAADTPVLDRFEATIVDKGGPDAFRLGIAAPTAANARVLHNLFHWTRPTSLRQRRTTIGMGDRLGVATPGHIRAARQFDAAPVLAQQSVRENDFIGRTFDDVVANATWAVFQEGYRHGYGADGDHLKTIPAIDVALSASMPMVTLDLTEVMRPEVADWTADQIDAGFRELPERFRLRVEQEYVDRTFDLKGTSVSLNALEARRCAVMYGPALAFSREVNDHLDAATGGAYDLEISIDETTTPTLPEHHLFIARELQHRGVLVNSLAPRFIGEFQKAIDYMGDMEEFHRQFRIHCLIAREYGGYKISVHSGSDKFAVYPIVGRETGHRLHLKTSGTSWLEALRTIAVHDPELYRRIHAFVLEYYPTALTFYHITANFDAIPSLDGMSDERLPEYLDHPDARQMLHIAYGGVLQHTELARDLYASLLRLEEEYALTLVSHFTRHIAGLGVSRSDRRTTQ